MGIGGRPGPMVPSFRGSWGLNPTAATDPRVRWQSQTSSGDRNSKGCFLSSRPGPGPSELKDELNVAPGFGLQRGAVWFRRKQDQHFLAPLHIISGRQPRRARVEIRRNGKIEIGRANLGPIRDTRLAQFRIGRRRFVHISLGCRTFRTKPGNCHLEHPVCSPGPGSRHP